MAAPPQYTELNDLAVDKNGGKILFATDDWFATAENVLKAGDAEWKPGLFTEYGKWMDGWETRRRRKQGHDWCIVQLGVPGTIHGFNVDTSYFTGNYAPRVSIQAANLPILYPARTSAMGTECTKDQLQEINKLKSEEWVELVAMSTLQAGFKGSCNNYLSVPEKHINSHARWTHLRLNIYPDGGIARVRVYGQANPDWDIIPTDKLIDLSSMLMGGLCISYSNAFYGHPRNMISPGRADNTGDGWETARRLDRPPVLETDDRGVLLVPGQEWAIFRMGHVGCIEKAEVDTTHFRGNYPDSCIIEGCLIDENDEKKLQSGHENIQWKTLLPVQKLKPHQVHTYDYNGTLYNIGATSHIKLTIAPDGGVSRLRLWGYKQNPATLPRL